MKPGKERGRGGGQALKLGERRRGMGWGVLERGILVLGGEGWWWPENVQLLKIRKLKRSPLNYRKSFIIHAEAPYPATSVAKSTAKRNDLACPARTCLFKYCVAIGVHELKGRLLHVSLPSRQCHVLVIDLSIESNLSSLRFDLSFVSSFLFFPFFPFFPIEIIGNNYVDKGKILYRCCCRASISNYSATVGLFSVRLVNRNEISLIQLVQRDKKWNDSRARVNYLNSSFPPNFNTRLLLRGITRSKYTAVKTKPCQWWNIFIWYKIFRGTLPLYIFRCQP